MKIIDILLKDVYVTPDSYVLKSRILIRKGRALRAHGLEGLRGSIQCLSEAISVIVSYSVLLCVSFSHLALLIKGLVEILCFIQNWLRDLLEIITETER